METEQFETTLGDVEVKTTDYRGHSIEEVAKMATDKLISVSDTAPEPIKVQAYAFRELCQKVIAFYMQEAVNNHICTVCNQLEKQGQQDLANIIRRL